MHRRLCVLLLLGAALGSGAARAEVRPVITPALQRAAERAAPADAIPVWVFLAPKESGRLAEADRTLTPHARARRERNRDAGPLVDIHDVPVREEYVRQLRAEGVRLRYVSRWLNAVSLEVTPAAVNRVAALPFVRRMDVLRTARMPLPQPEEQPLAPPTRLPASLNYGAAAAQVQTINVPALHDAGYDGSGVWIAMFDSGVNNPGHTVFQNLDVMVTRDFVNGDSLITDQAGQMGSGNHGTMTLSVIGGYAPGSLIGPAYGATYILAKTENTSWERHIEEDAWVAAAEWVDSIGADIISSSVGYSNGFTNGEADYTWQDMDGATTIVTIGADIAASRGILVVNSAGNDGTVALPANTLIGPSDGDSVLCVGAVDAQGVRAGFSSVGPTSDGRIKPDVAGMGLGVTVASPFDQTSYFTSSGTSFSCPLVAGAAALILQARPTASNAAIMDALRITASQAATPDRLLGWGIVDAAAALAMLPTGADSTPPASSVAIRTVRPNPFNPATMIDFEVRSAGPVTIEVYDVTGHQVDTLMNGEYRAAGRHAVRYVSQRASGVYFVKLTTGGETATRKIVLLK